MRKRLFSSQAACSRRQFQFLEAARKIAETRRGLCLSEDYLNSKKYLQWQCSKGHQWRASLNHVKNNGTWCPFCNGNAKLDISVAQRVAKERGGVCLSTEYFRSIDNLIWRCSQGHEWTASLGSVKSQKTWCLICSGKAKLNINVASKLAEERGGECLTSEYVNVMSPMLWRCSKGHEWYAALRSIKHHQSWCPTCAGVTKLSVEVAQEIAKQRGGVCLSNAYKQNKAPLIWRCSEGHEWKANLDSVKNSKSWCPACKGCKRLGLDVAGKVAKERGGTCLSALYEGCMSPLKWRCSEGHEWNASLNSIKNNKTWCPHCSFTKKLSIDVAIGVASKRGGVCVSKVYVNNSQPLVWRCAEGHEWSATLNNVKNGNTWCPTCSGFQSEKECREIFSNLFDKEFPSVYPDWLKLDLHGVRRLQLDG